MFISSKYAYQIHTTFFMFLKKSIACLIILVDAIFFSMSKSYYILQLQQKTLIFCLKKSLFLYVLHRNLQQNLLFSLNFQHGIEKQNMTLHSNFMLSARTLIKASCVIGTEIYMVHTKLKDQIIYKLPKLYLEINKLNCRKKKHLRVISLIIDFLISVVKGYN